MFSQLLGPVNNSSAFFKKRGFYLHASWQYKYPFAVRTWTNNDFSGMFNLLQQLEMNHVMIWPMSEILPPPLSSEDQQHLINFRQVIKDAGNSGLTCWLTFCPNLSTTDTVRSQAFSERVFYPNMQKFRLDIPGQFEEYSIHLGDILSCLNNADGYVFIDGDPGGYPHAKPAEFIKMLQSVRQILNQKAEKQPEIIPWIWSGWGADWETEGVWKPDLKKLVLPFLNALKANPPEEPWALLPGRSIREGHANGRINFELIEAAGLLNRSTWLTYEIIEYEPTPPAFVLQLDDIRRVIKQELSYASHVRGIMGNAQQPVTALHNLFYFAKCARYPEWLNQSNSEVLLAFAEFLGGDASLLVPALSALHTSPECQQPDLPARLLDCRLTSEAADCIPGGPELYLQILATFTATCNTVFEETAKFPRNETDAVEKLGHMVDSHLSWWHQHRYVFSGEHGKDFQWNFTHPLLLQPVVTWLKNLSKPIDSIAIRDMAEKLSEKRSFAFSQAERIITSLLKIGASIQQ